MAKILGKDEATYAKERDGFLRDLQHFHDTRGTPFKRSPTLGGKVIDLYLFYTLVTSHGGWLKVNSRNAWLDIIADLQIPRACVNGSVALKQIYLRYLDRFERVHFLHEEADRGSDDDEESRHKRWSARALHSVPYTYNYGQHNVQEANREQNHLSTNLYKASDYDRLALSLISPLPNEQDFAINVCTLLSNDGKHTLKLEKHPRLLDYLLGHAGVFNHGSLRQLFVNYYNEIRKKPIHSFWTDVIESKEFHDLTDETKFENKSEESSAPKYDDTLVKDDTTLLNLQLQTQPIAAEPADSDSDCEMIDDGAADVGPFKLKLDDLIDGELFNIRRGLGTQDYVGQRVLQIATILRNLSFIEENVPVLVKNPTFVRFSLLCVSSQWNILRNLGMDMLSNISGDFIVKDLNVDILASSLMKLVSKGLQSDDRAACLSSLEVLNKLSQNEQNEDILLRSLQAEVYKRVCSFLSIHDVMLLIYTLECLYSLSSLGERSCNLIVINHGVIDTLVSLVTVEGKSYGPKACIGMKLVETVPTGQQQQQQQQQQQVAVVSISASPTTTSVTSSGVTVTNLTASGISFVPATSVTSLTTAIAATPVASAVHQTVTVVGKATPSTPMRQVQIVPQRLIAVSPSQPPVSSTMTTMSQSPIVVGPSGAMSAQQQIQQQHAHQQAIQENEQFALAWLRATYEPCSNGKIDHQELYKHYINSCSKMGRRGVIAPLHFPRCVRSVFGGTVGPNPMKPQNPNDPQFYDGIKADQAQDGASPASPILKAQLSAPPKQREAQPKSDAKSQAIAHPHLSQALLGTSSSNVTPTSGTQASTSQAGTNSTSLIKSLLATKVNDCMTTVSMRTATDCQNVAQVAARQQQQRLLAQQNSDQKTPIKEPQKTSQRPNGVRQLFNDPEVGDPSVSSTTQFTSLIKDKKEPPQPPPPPLAPLSNNTKTKNRYDNEDSDSIGNNSVASSSGLGTVGIGGVSSTEDGDNSLTSFEGLLNGIPNMENPLNEDSNSKDSMRIEKPLRLADLLEKKFEKSPPLLNGTLGKDSLRLGDRIDLVENHIEKALNEIKAETFEVKQEQQAVEALDVKVGVKRSASEELIEIDAKKPMLVAPGVNGGAPPSPGPDSSSSTGDEVGTVSTAAAKLFADMAADILEDEDEEQLMQEVQAPPQVQAAIPAPVVPAAPQVQNPLPQIIVDNNQQMLLTQPRQIIVSQPQMQTTNQVVISAGTQLKTQSGQTVIVQSAGGQARPVIMQQATNAGQFLLSQGLQGQVQLVASSQPGQYVIQTSGQQGAYVVAQPQTAVVHGQPQTVLLAQTAQQQGTPTKTIIILQQQPSNVPATHHQKVMVTPQGQQVVVTQVPRPMVHTSTVSNNVTGQKPIVKQVIVSTAASSTCTLTTSAIVTATTTAAATPSANNTSTTAVEEIRKPKIVRDLTTPYVCEWGDCNPETKFKSANEVYLHASAAHCPTGNEEVVCLWDRCDNMKRKRFSLMTHLHDKHCNTEVMRQALVRRKQAAQGTKVEPTPTTTTNLHPGYAPDAALHAIKRHALEFVNPKELQDDNEGPVTKSIRLTASLILRNLVIYSSHCKRYLKSYEPHLANVALSNVESSRTIAQVLYDMNDGSTHR